MKLSKKDARLRRATKFRAKHAERDVERLCVFKSSQHIYAQIISGCENVSFCIKHIFENEEWWKC